MKISKRAVILTGVIVLAIVALAVGVGPYIYRDATQKNEPTAPAVDTSTTPIDNATITDGTWVTAQDGSYAGYRVNEVLRGVNVTVVGRTSNVTAEVQVVDKHVTKGTVSIDVASIKTDNSSRDSYFVSTIAEADDHPTGTFTLTQPIDLALVTDSKVATITGTLALHGTQKEVTATIQVGKTNGAVQIAGSIPITWDDYGIVAPKLGFVTVEDTGTIEFLVKLQRQ